MLSPFGSTPILIASAPSSHNASGVKRDKWQRGFAAPRLNNRQC
jgi:hypothetical protein